jgi:hypothetical protein
MPIRRKFWTNLALIGLLSGLILIVGMLGLPMPAQAGAIAPDNSQIEVVNRAIASSDLSNHQLVLNMSTSIAPTSVQPIAIAKLPTNQTQISEAEVKQFVQQSESAANQRDIEQMLAAFVPEATISFTSEDGETVRLNLQEYRQVLNEVFLDYDFYRNMIVVEFVNAQGDRAKVGGTTYEKINYSDQPINGVSKWMATVVRQGENLRFLEVDSYIARAIPR